MKILFAFSFAALLFGCSSSSSSGSGSGVCNELALGDAPNAIAIGSTDAPPAATGGTIPDGTYWTESATVYGSDGGFGTAGKTVFQISGSEVEVAATSSETSTTIERNSYNLAIDGTNLTLSTTCPQAGSVDTYAYSVEPPADGSGGVVVTLYGKTSSGSVVGLHLVKH